MLDADLFWMNDKDWIKSGDLPLTLWHICTMFYIIFTMNGWYYSIVLCRSSKILKLMSDALNDRDSDEFDY